MPSSSDSSASHNTGALSRLLATQAIQQAPIGPETLLSAVLDAAADGIIVVGADGRILTYNDRFVEIWDMPRPILMTRDERQVLAAQIKHLTEPAEFVEHVDTLNADPDARAQGQLRFLDGRIVE